MPLPSKPKTQNSEARRLASKLLNCRNWEMPALDRINITYQRAGLVVLGISVDEDLRRSKEFAAAMSVSYPILFDTGTEIGKDYYLQKMPMTILVDRSGVVRYTAVGFRRGDERVYLDHIRELLRE